MKENLTHYRTCVCNVNYHMVWSVKYLKGISGRKLFEYFPEIRNQLWKGELWNHSYYVETVGTVSEENIRRYIEHQSKAYSFEISGDVPNAETVEAIKEVKRMKADPSLGKTYSNVDQMMEELLADV